MRGDELDHLAFGVGNVKAALEKLIAKRVEVAVPPSEAKGVTEVYVKDPRRHMVRATQLVRCIHRRKISNPHTKNSSSIAAHD
jgi:hypothetical protein